MNDLIQHLITNTMLRKLFMNIKLIELKVEFYSSVDLKKYIKRYN